MNLIASVKGSLEEGLKFITANTRTVKGSPEEGLKFIATNTRTAVNKGYT